LVYASAGVEPARLGNQLDVGSFPLYRRADVVGAPEVDHLEGLSYVPYEIASLMTDVSVSYNHSLTHPEQRSLGYLFDDMERPLALSFRENSGSQGLATAQRFSGHAVRSRYAEAEKPSPTQLAEKTR
jgi:hypothetical protein